ncbi:MAG: DUF3833 domain-containing protein [Marinagarivorans sp.]|nr:DUF3833 domain-containing protein [Marinagarivorans sp.]
MLMHTGQQLIGSLQRLKVLCLILAISILAACSQIKVTDYQNNQPRLVAEDFFNGPLSAHGVVKNRAGKVIRRFNATLQGSWQNGQGILDEDFIFDDGEKQKRVWHLNPIGDGRYKATANDVTGTGKMQIAGNSLFMDYVLQVPYKGKTLEVRVDDRMYLVDANTLINESTLYKWGFRVGAVLLVIKKEAIAKEG